MGDTHDWNKTSAVYDRWTCSRCGAETWEKKKPSDDQNVYLQSKGIPITNSIGMAMTAIFKYSEGCDDYLVRHIMES